MNVVITGSTRGIGRGLAEEFAARGHNVAISGRNAADVEQVVTTIQPALACRVIGHACDVSSRRALESLWQTAQQEFGQVDIWINNAGVTNRKLNLADLPHEQIDRVVGTNLLGLIYGCQVAIAGMLSQGHGKIFNMEGFGSDGMVQPGLSVYGSSKAAVRYLTRSLVKEYEATALVIGTMSPGIVVTDLLMKDLHDIESADFAKRKRFLNILADRVETVAPHLVDGALQADRSGADVRWMTLWRAVGRLIKSPFVRRDVVV